MKRGTQVSLPLVNAPGTRLLVSRSESLVEFAGHSGT